MAKFIHTNATAEALVLDAAWRQVKGPMKMYVFKKSPKCLRICCSRKKHHIYNISGKCSELHISINRL